MSGIRYFDKAEYLKEKQLEAKYRSGTGVIATQSATKWLMGDEAEIKEPEPSLFEARKRYMVPNEVRARTIKNMDRLGAKVHENINRQLPKGYSIPPLIDSRLLEQFPHLCVTQFSQVPLKATDDDIVCSLYVTNFLGDIMTSGDAVMFNVKSIAYNRMFFSVAWHRNELTDTMQIAPISRNGVMFKTLEPQVAFDSIVHMTTGISAMQWRANIEKAKAIKEAASAQIETPPASKMR